MSYYLYQLLENASLPQTLRTLKKKGLKDTFIIEEDATGKILIGGHSKKPIEISNALLIEEKKATVDWDEQWSLFAEHFIDGKAQIPLGNQTLLLTPGAGFGDLSHPTTALMLEMLKEHSKGESIVDIGTGSGILALAALLLGAQSAIGIDIDTAALQHARENAKLNNLSATFSKKLPKNLPKNQIFLMNMILPEQEALAPQQWNRFAKLWMVSGILSSQRKQYLAQATQRHWKLVAESEKLGWLAFIFSINFL